MEEHVALSEAESCEFQHLISIFEYPEIHVLDESLLLEPKDS